MTLGQQHAYFHLIFDPGTFVLCETHTSCCAAHTPFLISVLHADSSDGSGKLSRTLFEMKKKKTTSPWPRVYAQELQRKHCISALPVCFSCKCKKNQQFKTWLSVCQSLFSALLNWLPWYTLQFSTRWLAKYILTLDNVLPNGTTVIF